MGERPSGAEYCPWEAAVAAAETGSGVTAWEVPEALSRPASVSRLIFTVPKARRRAWFKQEAAEPREMGRAPGQASRSGLQAA